MPTDDEGATPNTPSARGSECTALALRPRHVCRVPITVVECDDLVAIGEMLEIFERLN